MRVKHHTPIFLTFLIFFLLFVNQAWAENWKVYHSSVEGTMSYDQSSIRKTDGNIVHVMTKTPLNEKGKQNAFAILQKMKIAPCNYNVISHEITLEYYDCLDRKYKIFSTTIYDTKNKIRVS